MTTDPKNIGEIAGVCVALSKSASTAEQHNAFAKLALSRLGIALDREIQIAIDLDRFEKMATHLEPSISSRRYQ